MRPVALITGASSGLGEQFAHLAAADGYDLVLVARRREVLDALAQDLHAAHGVEVRVMVCDLSEVGAAQRVAREVAEEEGAVSLLINNAGIGLRGEFRETRIECESAMLALNVVALTELTKLLLPGMLEKGEGRILNVGSTAAFSPGPGMAVYFASKAYVLSLSEALATELHGTGVTVTCLCPGPTRTGFAESAKAESTRLFSAHVMQASDVARIGYRACMRGRRSVVPGMRNSIMAFATRFAPRRASAAIAARMVR